MRILKLIIPIAVIVYSLFAGFPIANAANIHSTNKWAWNDQVGWINLYNSSSVDVSSTKITGYGNFCGSNTPCTTPPANYLSFDCNTSPYVGTNICAGGSSPQIDYWVTNNAGTLYGWAWSDAIGWISFCGGSANSGVCPGATGTVPYKVTIATSGPNIGDFSGWAWNDNVGWISFNCSDGGTCPTVNYKVNTLWTGITTAATGNITSVTYDTAHTKGVNYNSLIWKGSLNGGTGRVGFQLATSSASTGPWTFRGPSGTSASTDTYNVGPNTPVPIVSSYHINHRYYRYKVFLTRNAGENAPTVTDVVVNWSP